MTTTRKPTKEELAEAMSREPVYKAVRVRNKDKLISLWVDGTEEEPIASMNCKGEKFIGYTLTYRRGVVTSNGCYGIFCCSSIGAAAHQMKSNGRPNKCRVYEAYPIGEPIENDSGFGTYSTVLFPAIILGKRVVASMNEHGKVTVR